MKIERRVVKNRLFKFKNSSSRKIISKNHKIAIFKTKLNNPKVKIWKGREIFLRIGLMKKLNNPKREPIIKIIFASVSSFIDKKLLEGTIWILTPGINSLAKKRVRMPPKI